MREYSWVEFSYRPKREGLHDSGYRFIKVTGVRLTEPKGDGEKWTEVREELDQWCGCVSFYGPVDIDVTAEGTIRIVPMFNRAWINFSDDANFFCKDWDDVAGMCSLINNAYKAYLKLGENAYLKLEPGE